MNYLRDFVQSGEVEIKTGPFGTQLKASEYVEQGTPVLNVKNLGYSTVVKSKLDRVGAATLDRLNAHILHCGDIVFGRKGAVDRHAYIGSDEEGWMQGSDCIRVRVKTQRINPRYLSYYFLTPEHRAFMISMCSHGTTMASLNQKILEMVEIPLPDRAVQDRIVALLGSLDNKIELNQKINENLERQIFALFHANYQYPSENESWESGCIGDVMTLQRGYDLPKGKIVDGIYPVAGSTDTIAYHNHFTTEPPCIVMGRSGNIGGPRLYLQRCWAHNTTLFSKEYKNSNPYWVYAMLKCVDYRQFQGGSAVPTLNRNHVHAFSINIPPRTKQDEFGEFASTFFEAIAKNIAENKKLSLLRDAILPKLMSGEIDMSDVQR